MLTKRTNRLSSLQIFPAFTEGSNLPSWKIAKQILSSPLYPFQRQTQDLVYKSFWHPSPGLWFGKNIISMAKNRKPERLSCVIKNAHMYPSKFYRIDLLLILKCCSRTAQFVEKDISLALHFQPSVISPAGFTFSLHFFPVTQWSAWIP